ncbi:MAG: LysE family transporter [Desulfobacteraceae bacterium]|nr:LysE family transporter [Desulfobacteraceae bacterium]
MIHFLVMGSLLGFSAGIAPGPLLALVVSETLAHDVRSGIRVALAPLFSDLPIVLSTLFVLSKLSDFHSVLGGISLLGGGVIFYMGVKGIRTSGVVLDMENKAPNSLAKGVLVNVLSPHPYLFWISVGAPTMARAMEENTGAAIFFVASFYLFLVGSKLVLALIIGRSKSFLRGRIYVYTMRCLGLALCCLSLLLFREGLDLLGFL